VLRDVVRCERARADDADGGGTAARLLADVGVRLWPARSGRRRTANFRGDEQREAAGARFGAGGWAIANLAVGDLRRAAEWLEAAAKKAAARELDEGFFNVMALRANVTNDVLRQRELADVLSRVHGD
jgi:hypothetical protein